MKKFINNNKKVIELIISIIGLILAFITLKHNFHIINLIVAVDTSLLNYQNSNIHNVELMIFFIPIKYRKAIVHLYHKHFCKLAWCNFLFFLGGTIYTNLSIGYPALYHIGIIAVLEVIILTLEKRPAEKLNKIIDFINSIFR